jgi:hypothetical protein
MLFGRVLKPRREWGTKYRDLQRSLHKGEPNSISVDARCRVSIAIESGRQCNTVRIRHTVQFRDRMGASYRQKGKMMLIDVESMTPLEGASGVKSPHTSLSNQSIPAFSWWSCSPTHQEGAVMRATRHVCCASTGTLDPNLESYPSKARTHLHDTA